MNCTHGIPTTSVPACGDCVREYYAHIVSGSMGDGRLHTLGIMAAIIYSQSMEFGSAYTAAGHAKEIMDALENPSGIKRNP